jgi:hypothetical protein
MGTSIHAMAKLSILRAPAHMLCVGSLACLIGCGGNNDSNVAPASTAVPVTVIDRSHLANVGTTAPLDYSDPNLWLCRPGNQPNECDVDLDATEFLADGSRRVVPHVRATNPKFDCFYVYPTVDLKGDGNMTNLSDVSTERDPLDSQAVRFTRLCEVYAPLYRQVSLSGVKITGDGALALQDVRDAFRFYLEHLSNGRNFVIMGHSQGAAMLAAMMQTDVDPVPAVRSRMISALLIGGGLVVTQGQRTGDGSNVTMNNGIPLGLSFKNIPTCATLGETGCLIAYSSFSKQYPPGPHALFGRAPDGFETACVNPATIAGNPGLYRGSYFPVRVNQPFFSSLEPIPAGVTTPSLLYRNVFHGECVHRNGFSYLEISLQRAPGDQRAEPPYHSVVEPGFGLHLVDYNLPLDDLIDAVSQQAAAMH